jgi:Dyp-type peroxidase family
MRRPTEEKQESPKAKSGKGKAQRASKKSTRGKKAAIAIESHATPSKSIEALVAPESLSIAIKPQVLNKALSSVLKSVADLVVPFPKDIFLPALGGDSDSEVPGAPSEPIYTAVQRANIQGNILPGFNKDHQHFLFFRIRNVKRAKLWLRWIAPFISSMDEVLAWVRAFRSLRRRLGVDPPMCATWVNIAFSHRAIALLAGKADAAGFHDQSFRQGLAARSTYLGDPTDKRNPGHRSRWRVGGPKNEADIMVIVAADDEEDLATRVDLIKARAAGAQLKLLFEQRGDNLPGALRGHEHFGFKDGISQPGVRGKVSSAPGDFITPRYIDPADPRARFFAKPGQLLVWPGQFLLGEPRQATEDLVTAASSPLSVRPHWAALGSYVVCRRLRQDVPAFWKFAVRAAFALGISPVRFASMLVGRWPSGAPIMRSPSADNAALAADDWANNHFLYGDDTRPVGLRPIAGYAGDGFTQAQQDFLGNVCPHFAHVRKSNPRDVATDLGKPHDTMLRFILRRGIPFGPPLLGAKRYTSLFARKERGLMFISYGATIEDQFELLTRRWANSPLQPNLGGHDPIIGQRDERGDRDRYIDFPTPSGPRRIKMKEDWVIPTGGGYFFAPPIAAIADVLGA